ncbi:RimJ/RimL family protein N-acetyltransferase [Paenibacillus sp. BK033]|uniref:GNAT family N-acetyltransferase n=1 Tax=Paenibacillus sp. BK033 TaxID=2512133 RepID=UPI001049CF75|nr:GNAT family N-acetyltransferase [Paenibacillus sp. BK033]TCM96574.1 RimJ/RimL family protein N-acetyltransferase [Paenibacillus sp. BK033]
MVKIETARLRIREYTIEDLPELQQILADDLTMSFWPKPFDHSQSENWILTRGIENYQTGYGRYAVELKKTSEIIGDAGLLKLEIDGQPENDLGYIVKSDFWGQGFGYEAANALMMHGFEDLNLKRICANMPATHYASIKVAEKLGMKLEKRFMNKRNRNILTCLYVKS